MAIIRMCFAAALLGAMLGSLPAQDSPRVDKLEERQLDQAVQSARLEQKIEQMSAQLQRLTDYQQTAFYGIAGILGKYLIEGLITLARRKEEE